MRRYSQVFVVVALFCFLFPFIVISPAKNAGVYQMTGWEMLTSQNIGLSKQPLVLLHIPPRVPVLMALLSGGLAVLVMLAKRKDTAWIAAAGTIVAAVSLGVSTTSTFPVQLTDGQAVLYSFENPGHQILPAFYVSLILMGAAAVSASLGLRRQQPVSHLAAGAITRPALTSATAAVPQSLSSAVRPSSFCTKCGSGMASGARFCNRCGTAVVPLTPVVKPLEASAVANQLPLAAATPVAMPPVASSPSAVVSTAPTVAGPPAVAHPSTPPPLVPSSSPVRRFSFAAKLGFATAGVVLAGAAWLLLHPTTDNRTSVGSTTTVSISPLNVRVAPGATVGLRALVTGGKDSEVHWSIQEGTSGGSIEPGGATVQNGTVFMLANYRAPYLPGTYHVVAVSAADPTRKATAQVIVDYGPSRRF